VLYHGDCLEIDAWLKADVLVTDPPYGVNWAAGSFVNYRNNRQGIADTRSRGPKQIRSAPMEGDDSPTLRDSVLANWGDRPRMVFGTWRIPRPESVQHRLIWHKAGATPGPVSAAFLLQDEEIYVSGEGFRATAPPLRSVLVTAECRPRYTEAVGHPTAKPIRLMETLIDRCPLGVIADPFAGSGATLVAARNLGRKAIGVEIEERYCEIAARRLDQMCLDFGEMS